MRDDPTDEVWQDRVAENYESANYGKSLAGWVLRSSHKIVERPFDQTVNFGRVLEVGAGSGVHLEFVRHQFDEYWMTDTSTIMLDKIKARHVASDRIRIAQENATQLSFPNDAFDRVIAAHVLEHLPQPRRALREWVRVLRKGGVLSIVLPCDPGILWRTGRTFGPRRRAQREGIAYDFVMASEHPNSITNLIAFLEYYFEDISSAWWPFILPSSDLNLFYVANIRI
jgi:phosphatidylethanolamine/phosphatidyl-N-methylethanolamine N-methyltransferase